MRESPAITPGYPYEGALYWLFAEGRERNYSDHHPYYLSLFGPEPELLLPRSTALAALFDRVALAPADARLPDFGTYLSGDEYYHPDLRISVSRKIHEWDPGLDDLAPKLLELPAMQDALKHLSFTTIDHYTARDFLNRTLLQVKVANAEGSVLVGNAEFGAVIDVLLEHAGELLQTDRQTPVDQWHLEPTIFDMVGLSFPASTLENFADIRASREITEYANRFREAVGNAVHSDRPEDELLVAMRDAMQKEEIRANAADAFEAVGFMADLGGFIPGIGTLTTAIGIGADSASRGLDSARAKSQWYLLGPRMREIALKDVLKRISD